MTSKALTAMGVHHFVVVEPQQMDEYRKAIKHFGLMAEPLELDLSYKDKYDLCDNLGLTKSTGPGPARNFAWAHSKAAGDKWHWVMDDNISKFFRLNRNLKIRCNSPAYWRAMEDFAMRYKNVAMAGPNYDMFVPRNNVAPQFVTNTRIYSCNFIRNDLPFRWRGRYNEDTILSLDMLKAGWCTIQFNAFLQNKKATQTMRGGNTQEFYHSEEKPRPGEIYSDTGTVDKSRMLVDIHTDVSRMVWKFGRWHHHVDYAPFKKNMLIRGNDAAHQAGHDDYGMVLTKHASGSNK